MALDWGVQAHNNQTCYQREAHRTLVNVNPPVQMAKVESGKHVYLGKVMLDGCDQEDIGLATPVEYSGTDVRNIIKMLGKNEQCRRAKCEKCETLKSSRWLGFRSRIAIDGSLKSISEKNAASGWSVVQLDHNGERPRAAVCHLSCNGGMI